MESCKSFVFKVSFMISFSFCCLDHGTQSFESFDVILGAKWLFVWTVTSGARLGGWINVTIFVTILGYENLITKLSIPCTTIWRMIIDIHACTELERQGIIVNKAMQVRKLMQMSPSHNGSNENCFWNDWEAIHFVFWYRCLNFWCFERQNAKVLYVESKKNFKASHGVTREVIRKSSW